MSTFSFLETSNIEINKKQMMVDRETGLEIYINEIKNYLQSLYNLTIIYLYI